jgi:hypothetical protein
LKKEIKTLISTDLERWLWLVIINFNPLHFHFVVSFIFAFYVNIDYYFIASDAEVRGVESPKVQLSAADNL